MSPRPIPRSDVTDRRVDERFATDAHVQVRIDATSIAGTAENVSASGLLFFALDCPRVEVEVTEPGNTRVLHGRLVRMQRMRGNATGYAVEFDPISKVSENQSR